MNTAVLPMFGPRPAAEAQGVSVALDDLMRLRARASGFSFLPKQPVHSILAGKHASRLRGRGLNFEEIRHYNTGDDIRTMDWRVTARTRQPHVRVYTEERDRPVLLVVDQRRSMFFGSQKAMKSVVAAEIAALSAWRVLSQGDRVAAIVFDDDELAEFAPRRSEVHVQTILADVARRNRSLSSAMRPQPPNAEMYDRAIARAAKAANHDFLVIIISDGFGAGPQSVKHITSLAAHNDVMAAFVYDPLEAKLPDRGILTFSDGSRQLEVNSANAKLRRTFADGFIDWTTQIEQLSKLRQIPVLAISAAEDVVDQVQRQLGKRLESSIPTR
jgi:uncharacterized protein (DUF58 family)